MQTFNSGSLLQPKIVQEQGGGIYAWDVALSAVRSGSGCVKPMRWFPSGPSFSART